MSLQAPPKTEKPSRVLARFVTLIIMATAAFVVIYTAVVNQQADVAEDIRSVNLELEDTTVIDGFRTNVRRDPGGPTPVVILHDVDVTGGLILDDLSLGLGESYHGVRIDLPGFGYSTRMPTEGPHHTVARLAERLAPVLEERFDAPVLVIGAGLGGEVGAELALSHPDMIDGLVMVDVDFWSEPRFPASLESFPWLGKAATYTWETGGRFALDNWAPHCDEGGWCPTREEVSIRSLIIEVENTTDSLHGFRSTPDAALAPSNLTDIMVPVTYVWSTEGEVPEDTVERMRRELPSITVTESSTFQAHLEDPPTVASALASIDQ
ncbi:MAG TPA: alpha/beta hydrolase [Acidimicrobiia bacterium]